jgi:predicted Zn-dependent protease
MRTKRHTRAVAATFTGLAAIAILAASLQASGSGSGSSSEKPQQQTPGAESADVKPYDRGMELVQAEQYADARKIFEQLSVEQPKNAEVLNMLAYTQRKTGDIDVAIENYGRALKLKPKFPQAREYLAEAYLQAALREAETLKGYGGSGEKELKKLADAFQEAASHLDGSGAKGTKSAGSW